MTPEEWERALSIATNQRVMAERLTALAAYKRRARTAHPIPAHSFRLLLTVLRGLESLAVDGSVQISTTAILQACAMAEAGGYEEFQPKAGTLIATLWLVDHIDEIADALSNGYLVGVEVH